MKEETDLKAEEIIVMIAEEIIAMKAEKIIIMIAEKTIMKIEEIWRSKAIHLELMRRGTEIMKESRTGKFLGKLTRMKRERLRKKGDSVLTEMLLMLLLRRILKNTKRHKIDQKILRKNKKNQEMLKKREKKTRTGSLKIKSKM